MKYIITTALLLSAIVSKAQQPVCITNTGTVKYGFPGENLPDRDTLHVLYLLSDTSFVRGFWTERTPMSFARTGYIAERKVADQWNESFWMVSEANLDENRKPLPPGYVIWQTKLLSSGKP
jgi:hypothetical protein